MSKVEPTLFELSRRGKRATRFRRTDIPGAGPDELLPENYRRKETPALPEVTEPELVRHYTLLSKLNLSIDTNFYPLGSCTMKYNPKRNDRFSTLTPFLSAHPYQPEELSQGVLELLYELEQALCEICGVRRFSLQPAAGAQAEFVGLMMVRAYHNELGNKKHVVLVPDSSHGTNPASAALVGYAVQTVKSNREGIIDLEDLKRHLGPHVACLIQRCQRPGL